MSSTNYGPDDSNKLHLDNYGTIFLSKFNLLLTDVLHTTLVFKIQHSSSSTLASVFKLQHLFYLTFTVVL